MNPNTTQTSGSWNPHGSTTYQMPYTDARLGANFGQGQMHQSATNNQSNQQSLGIKEEGNLTLPNQNSTPGTPGSLGNTNQVGSSTTTPQSSNKYTKSDWIPKSLYYDPNKTKWEAFKLKFLSYVTEKHWTSDECKSKLLYILEGKAAEFYATLHEREPTLPFFDVLTKMEARFAFKELPETSQLAFLNASQNKDEKIEEWADRVLTLASKAYRTLPEDHIQKQAVLRFCHGCFDRNAGMHAANKMLSRMEEAIDCVKWFQYNQQYFNDKPKERRNVNMVGESQPFQQYIEPALYQDPSLLGACAPVYSATGPQVWATAVNNPPPTTRPKERYIPYKGSPSPSPSKQQEGEKDSSSSETSMDDRMSKLEQRFERMMANILKANESKYRGRQSSSPSGTEVGTGRSLSPTRCFGCNEEGHFKRDCPKKRKVSFNVRQVEDDDDDLNYEGSGTEA